MFCSGCGTQVDQAERFCRKCGTTLTTRAASSELVQLGAVRNDKRIVLKDPDEMTGNGIGSVIVGDGFLMVAVILSATHTSISSLLWLLLLIPAFFFFGKGFADVLHAKQIRRRMTQDALNSESKAPELTSTPSFEFLKSISAELLPSVTERTTRELK